MLCVAESESLSAYSKKATCGVLKIVWSKLWWRPPDYGDAETSIEESQRQSDEPSQERGYVALESQDYIWVSQAPWNHTSQVPHRKLSIWCLHCWVLMLLWFHLSFLYFHFLFHNGNAVLDSHVLEMYSFLFDFWDTGKRFPWESGETLDLNDWVMLQLFRQFFEGEFISHYDV